MDIFWDHDGSPQITPSGGSSSGQINHLRLKVENLNRRVDRLSLACQALWELLQETGPVTEAELKQKMIEVDLRDGERDGKMAVSILVCQNCGNRTNSRRKQCIYCGHHVVSRHTFE